MTDNKIFVETLERLTKELSNQIEVFKTEQTANPFKRIDMLEKEVASLKDQVLILNAQLMELRAKQYQPIPSQPWQIPPNVIWC